MFNVNAKKVITIFSIHQFVYLYSVCVCLIELKMHLSDGTTLNPISKYNLFTTIQYLVSHLYNSLVIFFLVIYIYICNIFTYSFFLFHVNYSYPRTSYTNLSHTHPPFISSHAFIIIIIIFIYIFHFVFINPSISVASSIRNKTIINIATIVFFLL